MHVQMILLTISSLTHAQIWLYFTYIHTQVRLYIYFKAMLTKRANSSTHPDSLAKGIDNIAMSNICVCKRNVYTINIRYHFSSSSQSNFFQNFVNVAILNASSECIPLTLIRGTRPPPIVQECSQYIWDGSASFQFNAFNALQITN